MIYFVGLSAQLHTNLAPPRFLQKNCGWQALTSRPSAHIRGLALPWVTVVTGSRGVTVVAHIPTPEHSNLNC